MDLIDDILTTMRIESSRYMRIEASGPWGVSFQPREAARLVLIADGECWLTSGALAAPVRMGRDDCFIVQAGTDFMLSDELGREAVDCEEAFTAGPAGTTEIQLGGDGARTDIVSGRFSFDATAAEPLFALLPSVFQVRLDEQSAGLIRSTLDLIAREGSGRGVGANLITSRLADVLFVQAMRACCAGAASGAIGWLAALRDPQLAAAMEALHADLAYPWTVEELARKAGLSRSAFAAAFRARAGDTPIGYLTSWRLYRAKMLMRETPMSLHEIALQVGYESGAALSRVFARHEGTAPGAWRQQARAAAAASAPLIIGRPPTGHR
jgi:AraC-like DNA-binding protein